ncbi:hypothetical protein ACE6H2_009544 [Prunus campanulata]
MVLHSALTRDVLILIINGLPFREAAATSVVCPEMRDIWTSSKNIELNESFFLKKNRAASDQIEAFIHFVERFLELYQEPHVVTLKVLFSHSEQYPNLMTSCIRFSVNHKTRHLTHEFADTVLVENHLEISGECLNLPTDFYNHKHLESLTLAACKVEPSHLGSFGVLKELSLVLMDFQISDLPRLLSACKFLESLTLKRCSFVCLAVSSHKLGTLLVDECSVFDSEIMIDTPNLKYLKYTGPVPTYIQNAEGLEELNLNLGMEYESYDRLVIDRTVIYDILSKLRPNRALTVSSYMIQAFSTRRESVSLSPPLTVRHLTLNIGRHYNEEKGIQFFLSSCPRLETLSIEVGPGRKYQDYVCPSKLNSQQIWTRAFECITPTLRVVEFKGYRDRMYEHSLLMYLLKHGNVLEAITVITANTHRDLTTHKLRLKKYLHGVTSSRHLHIAVL